MDISNALIAKSDQLNSVDLISGPQTVAFMSVAGTNAEQPVNIVTDVFGDKRPFKPSKTVLRVLAAAWGVETQEWVGRRATLYRDPSVKWAGEEIGGIRIQALSHIDKPMHFNLPTSKGKHAKSIVQPLAAAPVPRDESGRDWLAELKLAGDNLDAITTLGAAARTANAGEHIIKAILAEHGRVKAAGQVGA